MLLLSVLELARSIRQDQVSVEEEKQSLDVLFSLALVSFRLVISSLVIEIIILVVYRGIKYMVGNQETRG